MPKSNFFNLEIEKQNIILDIAYNEFAKHNYETASLSKIVEELAIAKGTMYRYFEDKKDLYMYLIDQASKRNMEYLMRSTKEIKQEDFFETIKTIICYGHRFAIENPKRNILLTKVYLGNNDPFHKDGLNNLMKHGGEWVRTLVENAKETGQISKNYDTEIIVHVIYQTSIDMFKFIINKHNMTYDDILNIKNSEAREELNIVINQFMQFIKYGLRGKLD